MTEEKRLLLMNQKMFDWRTKSGRERRVGMVWKVVGRLKANIEEQVVMEPSTPPLSRTVAAQDSSAAGSCVNTLSRSDTIARAGSVGEVRSGKVQEVRLSLGEERRL